MVAKTSLSKRTQQSNRDSNIFHQRKMSKVDYNKQKLSLNSQQTTNRVSNTRWRNSDSLPSKLNKLNLNQVKDINDLSTEMNDRLTARASLTVRTPFESRLKSKVVNLK